MIHNINKIIGSNNKRILYLFIFMLLVGICYNFSFKGIVKDVVNTVKKAESEIKNGVKTVKNVEEKIKEVKSEVKEVKNDIKTGESIIKNISTAENILDSISSSISNINKNSNDENKGNFLDNLMGSNLGNLSQIGESMNLISKFDDLLKEIDSIKKSDDPTQYFKVLFKANSYLNPNSQIINDTSESNIDISNPLDIIKIAQLFLDLSANISKYPFLKVIVENYADKLIKNENISKEIKSQVIDIIFDSGKDEQFRTSLNEILIGLSGVIKNYKNILNDEMTGLNDDFAKEFPKFINESLIDSFSNLTSSNTIQNLLQNEFISEYANKKIKDFYKKEENLTSKDNDFTNNQNKEPTFLYPIKFSENNQSDKRRIFISILLFVFTIILICCIVISFYLCYEKYKKRSGHDPKSSKTSEVEFKNIDKKTEEDDNKSICSDISNINIKDSV